MNPSIPASAIVSVNPSVISAGGSALDLNGLFFTITGLIAASSVKAFASPKDVSNFFGPSSDEATAAAIYFAGFDGSNKKPGSMLFATEIINSPRVIGAANALTLAQIQALDDIITVSFNGMAYTATVNLATASSPSDAATKIQTALNAAAEVTTATATITGTTMDVSAVLTGTLVVGMLVTGTSVTSNSYIVSDDGAGLYTLSKSSSVAVGETITGTAPNVGVNYFPSPGCFVVSGQALKGANNILLPNPTGTVTPSGALAAALNLTTATGATLSQALGSPTVGGLLDSVTAVTQNWATFTTLFDPDGGSGNAQKLAIAAWVNAQNNRYAYIAWDTDITPTATVPATSSLGYLIAQANDSGTLPIFSPDFKLAAFICGAVASLDFTQRQGRATLAFKSQSGLSADVTNETVGANLIANGYNFYGAYATANQPFTFFNPGRISGAFKWADSYVNQIWLNNALQLALMTLLTQVKSIPYNAAGYSQIRAASLDPINAALNFGAIQPGVVLSALQASEVNTAAGMAIDKQLSSVGYYLQILPATAITRGARQSPPCTLWYMDGGSVQQINLASIMVQ